MEKYHKPYLKIYNGENVLNLCNIANTQYHVQFYVRSIEFQRSEVKPIEHFHIAKGTNAIVSIKKIG